MGCRLHSAPCWRTGQWGMQPFAGIGDTKLLVLAELPVASRKVLTAGVVAGWVVEQSKA